jgi:hypothetical protein
MKKEQLPEGTHIIMDLPEVKDIPGQEHIKPPKMHEMMDSTPSSADEEGEGLLDDVNKEDYEVEEDDTNVTPEEIKMLDDTDRVVNEETQDLDKLVLDPTDEEDPNETNNPRDMGEDLDIPGSELDDDNEELGEEDEENNSYSQRD